MPWVSVGSIVVEGHVAGFEELKTCFLHGVGAHTRVGNVGKSVALLNVFLDAFMLGVSLFVQVRHAPLVARKDRARFQHAENLFVDPHPVGCVTRRFNGVGSVELLVGKWHFHKVSLSESATIRHDGVLLAKLIAAIDLVLVEGQSRHVGLGETTNVAEGTANATSDVEKLGGSGNAEFGSQFVLVTTNGLIEGLVSVPVGKMKGLTPAPLVKDSGQVVIGVDQILVFRVAFLHGLFLMQSIVILNAIVHTLGSLQTFLLLTQRHTETEDGDKHKQRKQRSVRFTTKMHPKGCLLLAVGANSRVRPTA